MTQPALAWVRPVMPEWRRRLTLPDKLSLSAEILVAYARARRLLRGTDLRTILDRVRPAVTGDDRAEADATYLLALRLGHAVTRTLSVLPMDAKCLVRSVVLSELLARRAIASRLVIGVRRNDAFEAHAWVTYDGRPLLPVGDYSELQDF